MVTPSTGQVILVSDPRWTCHPVGRAHWRLLWSVGNGKKPLDSSEAWSCQGGGKDAKGYNVSEDRSS